MEKKLKLLWDLGFRVWGGNEGMEKKMGTKPLLSISIHSCLCAPPLAAPTTKEK